MCIPLISFEQVSRLEQTWTSLRHHYTQTAIMYEKQLKPFSKALHEGQGKWNNEHGFDAVWFSFLTLPPPLACGRRQTAVLTAVYHISNMAT